MTTPSTASKPDWTGHRAAWVLPVMLAAAATLPAHASSFIAKIGIETIDYACCGYYPFFPSPPAQVTLVGGGEYEFQGHGAAGASRSIGVGSTLGTFSISSSILTSASDAGNFYNQIFTNVGLESTWSTGLRVEAPGTASGSTVPVKLYAALMYGAGRYVANGTLLGMGLAATPTSPYVTLETTISLVTGADNAFSARLGLTALSNAGHGSTQADYASATLLWHLEPSDPAQRLTDDEGHPLPNWQPLMEGLFPSSPIMPTGGGSKTSGEYDFEAQVMGGATYYFDPPGTAGYEYEVTSGPMMSGLLLPAVGDGHYRVALWNGSTWVDVGSDVLAGQRLDLTALQPGGVARLRVQGIEAADPAARNFLTGLSFAGTGSVVMKQTALAVPEPGTWALWAAGLAVMAGRRRGVRGR